MAWVLATALSVMTMSAKAQQPAAQEPLPDADSVLKVQSSIVFIPTTVQTKKGEVIYGLRAGQFVVEADGVPQTVMLDNSEDVRPVALAVVVQCSRSYADEYPKMQGVNTMIEAMLGGGPSQVAVLDFGSEPEVITNFTTNTTRRERALGSITPCDDDPKAAIFDAVAAANKLFERMDPKGRHVILLLSETRDHGSKIKAEEVIRALGKTDTIVESLAYSPGRDAVVEDLKHSDGAAGGPIGLILMAVQALRKNVSKELARESGGEYINFGSQQKFDMGLNGLANRVDNYYLLSFQPHFAPGQGEAGNFHRLTVKLPEYPNANIHHRESYWSDAAGNAEKPAAK
ncbi:VWA domain-containing protein [Granulicella cerasi]|uniref:VWA domain-containing protein n=1 Tax=Granulicella cerasi TaxID=741063 RepID=A0ABW1Z9L1_9BACT|nr:VWA domain-containing protein [Granulicella cerasi]